MYDEIEINVVGRDNELEPYTFNRANIAHYRRYVDTPAEVGAENKFMTMVYMMGSPAGIRIQCSYDEFKNKVGGRVLDLSNISDNDFQKIRAFVDQLRNAE